MFLSSEWVPRVLHVDIARRTEYREIARLSCNQRVVTWLKYRQFKVLIGCRHESTLYMYELCGVSNSYIYILCLVALGSRHSINILSIKIGGTLYVIFFLARTFAPDFWGRMKKRVVELRRGELWDSLPRNAEARLTVNFFPERICRNNLIIHCLWTSTVKNCHRQTIIEFICLAPFANGRVF